MIYHHLPNTFLKLLNLWINNFSLEQFNSRKSLSTEQDLNLHPSVSGWVPLPLDHLHSCFSLLFNSYPRASIVSNPGPWHIVHVHCMHRVLWDPNVHAHHPLLRRCSYACTLVIYHHLPNTFLKLLNLWINNFSLEQFNSRKSLSTEQDLNLHPSVSGWVPLPLDHLHSCFSLLFNSYPRASIVSNPGPWHIAHVHCMHRVLWDVNVHAHCPLSRR